jgi:hypothetical protein
MGSVADPLTSLSSGDRVELVVGDETLSCEVLLGERDGEELTIVAWLHPGTMLCRVVSDLAAGTAEVSTRHCSEATFTDRGMADAIRTEPTPGEKKDGEKTKKKA